MAFFLASILPIEIYHAVLFSPIHHAKSRLLLTLSSLFFIPSLLETVCLAFATNTPVSPAMLKTSHM